MSRPRTTNTLDMAGDIVVALHSVRTDLPEHLRDSDALATLETFVAVALRIIAKTNPSKVREIARAVEIQSMLLPWGNRNQLEKPGVTPIAPPDPRP